MKAGRYEHRGRHERFESGGLVLGPRRMLVDPGMRWLSIQCVLYNHVGCAYDGCDCRCHRPPRNKDYAGNQERDEE